MKAICKVVRLRGRKSSAEASLAYVYAKGAPVCGQSPVGIFVGKASVDSLVFTETCDAFGRVAEVRHVVISSDVKPSPEANRTLALMAQDWARIWANGRPWVGVLHNDKDHAHIHLVIANRGDDGRCLPLWSRRNRADENAAIYGTGSSGISGCGPDIGNACRITS